MVSLGFWADALRLRCGLEREPFPFPDCQYQTPPPTLNPPPNMPRTQGKTFIKLLWVVGTLAIGALGWICKLAAVSTSFSFW